MENLDLQSIINNIHQQYQNGENHGEIATYIPELKKINPNKLGIHISTLKGNEYGVGDHLEKFSIQSIAKVLSLAMVYRKIGESLWKRMNVEPSGTGFNSLVQLESNNGIPRNPLINSGAIVICDIIISEFPNPNEALLDFFKEVSGIKDLKYSNKIADSEKSIGYRNMALGNFIKSFDNIHNDPGEVLDLYFNLCSIEMSCQELSNAFLFLINQGMNIETGKKIVSPIHAKRINAVMQTCGFYDESGDFAFRVGLPGKSGVGGGIVAVNPGKYVIVVWSPVLNPKGNSYRGLKCLERFTTETNSSLF